MGLNIVNLKSWVSGRDNYLTNITPGVILLQTT